MAEIATEIAKQKYIHAALSASAVERMKHSETVLADYAQRVFDANQGL